MTPTNQSTVERLGYEQVWRALALIEPAATIIGANDASF